ncbi:MAG: hypothetical protein AUK63_1241 [bacterium P3]|nr:MAG: hypothetical protein AUK63_1241 [bacterium P3]KWW40517.1 MAG: hypothetical protein F083_1586 [bacterium F083]
MIIEGLTTKRKRGFLTLFLALLMTATAFRCMAQTQIALLKYNGGGDWYANPTSLSNLIAFCNADAGMRLAADYAIVEAGSSDLFNYPFVHMTGHGNVTFSQQEAQNLRQYLAGGGFLHIDDNYGMKDFIVPQMKKVFPELEFVELPFDHPLYHQKYDFPDGLPKIHEHDNLPPRGYGLIYEGRLVCFFSWECDLGDGWEDADVHNDSPATRQKALRMGQNLLQYVFSGGE